MKNENKKKEEQKKKKNYINDEYTQRQKDRRDKKPGLIKGIKQKKKITVR